jgi:uncharacterized protein (TIGR03083 family)
MRFEWTQSQAAYADAAGWFLRTVDQVGERWEQPGLGEWDVRALVGHTCRSFLTVEEYLATPPAEVEVETTADYYRAITGISDGPAVAQRGRDAGAALGDDPAATSREIAGRVLRLVETLDGSELLTTIAGGMRLADYLPTRTFELAVHTSDLATALGESRNVPPTAARQALTIVADLAAAPGELAGRLLLLATGRDVGPFGASVLSPPEPGSAG